MKKYAVSKNGINIDISNYVAGTYYVSLIGVNGKMLYSTKFLKH
jgi:hypothetical protein